MPTIRIAPAGRGAAWFIDGFQFVRPWLMTWVGISLLLMIIGFMSMSLPAAGILMQLFTPVFAGGLLLGCHDIANGGRFHLQHLLAGFGKHAGNLILVGLLYMLGSLLIVAVISVIAIMAIGVSVLMSAMAEPDALLLHEHLLVFLVLILIGLSLYLPLLMAFWFAPALVVFEQASAASAMKLSFIGCLKNMPAFLVYGLVGLLLAILATIPMMLGWLVLIPVTIAGIYIAYRDIYADPGSYPVPGQHVS